MPFKVRVIDSYIENNLMFSDTLNELKIEESKDAHKLFEENAGETKQTEPESKWNGCDVNVIRELELSEMIKTVLKCDFNREQEKSDSLFPTFGLNGLGDNGGICGTKCKLKYGKWDFDIWKWPKKKKKRFVIDRGEYAARDFVEKKMADGKLCIIFKEAFAPYVADDESADGIAQQYSNCDDEWYMHEEGSGKGLIGEEEMNINEKHKEELNKTWCKD
ncbi:hypothetical protein Tco_1331675 [Tanacetum coccineum]